MRIKSAENFGIEVSDLEEIKNIKNISIKKYRIVIFIDSCFWHNCSICGKMKNVEYWGKKLKGNVERDKEVTNYYIDKGWNILRVWEHSFKKDFNGTNEEIVSFINMHKNSSYKI